MASQLPDALADRLHPPLHRDRDLERRRNLANALRAIAPGVAAGTLPDPEAAAQFMRDVADQIDRWLPPPGASRS